MMKTRFMLFVAVLILFFGVQEVLASSCSCTAPDGSCSASITCSGGCIATCGTGGNCSAKCSSASGGGTNGGRQQPAPLEGDPTAGAMQGRLVNLDIQSANSRDISELLSAQLGLSVGFVNAGPEDMLTVHAVDFPVDELIAWLRRFGSVAVSDKPIAAPGAGLGVPSDQRVTLQASDASAQTLVELLGEILGSEVRFTPRDPQLRISVDVKDASVGEVLEVLERYGTVEVP